MFSIHPSKKIITDFPIIISDYTVLLDDDNESILFSGKNKYLKTVLCSLVENDYETKICRYFHIVIKEEEYEDFINGKITYLEICKRHDMYIIDENFNKDDDIAQMYKVTYKDIPEDYLPTNESYYTENSYYVAD